MKQIDYETAIHMMAFEGRTDIRIMVREVEPVDIHTLYALQKDGQVMFFIQEDPLSNPADKSNTPPQYKQWEGCKEISYRQREDTSTASGGMVRTEDCR